MPFLHVVSLTCVRTQQSVDQTYLVLRPGSGASVSTDPRRMVDGGSALLDLSMPFGINDEVEVQVWEQDPPPARSDLLGSFTVDRAYQGTGEFPFHIHHRRAHYIVTAEVTESARRPGDYTIDLIRLDCRDAQERTDRPFLKVNGEQVWGPVDMRTGQGRDLDVSRSFHRNLFVDLWEEDAGGHGSDHFGTMGLVLSGVQAQSPGGPRTYTFRRDRGIVGDASYVLTYDLHR